MRRILIVTACAVVALAGAAQAQKDGLGAEALRLFREGRALMAAKQYEAACARFRASVEAASAPAVGVTYNLARCYERLGKLASAWRHYREAARIARQLGQSARAEAFARRAGGLEPRLARVVIRVPEGARIPGLVITRDGAPVDAAALDAPRYVDRGTVAIEATAPDRRRFSVETSIDDGAELIVDIPVLEPLAPEPEPEPEPNPEPEPEPEPEPDRASGEQGRVPIEVTEVAPAGAGARIVSPGAPGASPSASPGASPSRNRRILGLALGGGGVVSVAVGIGFGASAITSYDAAVDAGLCDPDTDLCTLEGKQQTDSARTKGHVSTVLVGAGVALAAVGAVLYLTAPDRRPDRGPRSRPASTVVPVVGPGGVGVAVLGGF